METASDTSLKDKLARIKKLKKSENIIFNFSHTYELNRSSAKQWIKKNLRGNYRNLDTGNIISISKSGIDKVTSHGEREMAHLKSLEAIPLLIEKSIFITEEVNEKDHDKFEKYQYYVCGINIDGEYHTAKIVVGFKNNRRYYDHELTHIEKRILIDSLNGIAKPVAKNKDSFSVVKDKRLLMILQGIPEK